MIQTEKIVVRAIAGITLISILNAAAMGNTAPASETVTLVQDGIAQVHLVIPEEVSSQILQAAQLLGNQIEQSSGATVPIFTRDVSDSKPGLPICIGLDAPPKTLDADGFVISVEKDRISIAGPTDWGTEFGVYEFMERFLDVRWLMPGPDGTDAPEMKTITVPTGIITDEPVFFSRVFSGLPNGIQKKWARFNRMHLRVEFHHNMVKLFPAKTYTKTHPEFFPLKADGTRYLPIPSAYDWQPCFSDPAVIKEAIRNIVAHFNKHPEETSYSLGMNDALRFCLCPECKAQFSDQKNFLGDVDKSDLYYGWCNRVIEGVLKVHPDKWFGCLAYHNVATPPKQIKIHPRLIPFMTYERLKWIDPEIQADGHAVTEAWEKMSETTGWYDYYYGSPYCVPRISSHQTQSTLQYAHDHHVKAMYAELYPNWGEGPKAYILLKLWWNPDTDVDALLQDWCERCAGPEAGPLLVAYYQLWEKFWTEDILESSWFTKRDQWLAFNRVGYLEDVKMEDIVESRRLLDTALEQCRTEKQKARVSILRQAFDYYEASVQGYQTGMAVASATPKNEEEALQLLEQSLDVLSLAETRRHLSKDVFGNDPVLIHPVSYDRHGGVAGNEWGAAGWWKLVNWVSKDGNAVTDRLTDLAKTSDSDFVRFQAAAVLAIGQETLVPASKNSSFEKGSGETAQDWWFWVKAKEGQIVRTTKESRTGSASILCEGVQRGGPVQKPDFQGPGDYCAMAWIYTPEGQERSGMVELTISPKIPGTPTRVFNASTYPEPGKWTLIITRVDLTDDVYEGKSGMLQFVPVANHFKAEDKLYMDDVGLYKMPHQ